MQAPLLKRITVPQGESIILSCGTQPTAVQLYTCGRRSGTMTAYNIVGYGHSLGTRAMGARLIQSTAVKCGVCREGPGLRVVVQNTITDDIDVMVIATVSFSCETYNEQSHGQVDWIE